MTNRRTRQGVPAVGSMDTPPLELLKQFVEELETKLLEGLKSPQSKLTASDWSVIRKEAMARVRSRGAAKTR
jgi:hypothetical protein